jgi:hypothetical protein
LLIWTIGIELFIYCAVFVELTYYILLFVIFVSVNIIRSEEDAENTELLIKKPIIPSTARTRINSNMFNHQLFYTYKTGS